MTEDQIAEARKVMETAEYHYFEGIDTVCLDGWFSAKELRAVLVLLEAGEDYRE